MASKIAPTTDRGCFIVRTQYGNGNTYWHGFADKAGASAAMQRARELDVGAQLHFGAVTMNDVQARECCAPKGCVFDKSQLTKFLKEVK